MKLKMTLDKWKNSIWKDIQDILLSEINKEQNSIKNLITKKETIRTYISIYLCIKKLWKES